MGWKVYRAPFLTALTAGVVALSIRAIMHDPFLTWTAWVFAFAPLLLIILIAAGGETSVYLHRRADRAREALRAIAAKQAACSHGDIDGPTIVRKTGVRPDHRHIVTDWDECTQCGKIDPPRMVEDDRGVWIPEACAIGHVYGPVERVDDPVTGEEFYRRCTVCREAFPQDRPATPYRMDSEGNLVWEGRMSAYGDMTGVPTRGFGTEGRIPGFEIESTPGIEVAIPYDRIDPDVLRMIQSGSEPGYSMSFSVPEITVGGRADLSDEERAEIERVVAREIAARAPRPASSLPRTTAAQEIEEMAAHAYEQRNRVQPGAMIRKRRKINVDG